ncbi:O-methyl transferase B protein [Rutstroemia sp. NJR-2017a BBW]|nr:O-methyl transferase B protein [Rutstroemia sp. NJR-2017a BBW]
METILDQLSQLSSSVDRKTKRELAAKLRLMADSLEDVDDTVNRYMYLHLQVAAVRVGIDLKLYDLLVASETPLSVEDIAKTTGASPLLLGPNNQALKLFNSLMRPQGD